MATISVDIAQTLNITCRRGDTFILDLTITNSSGAATNMTGYGGALLVKDSANVAVISFFTATIADRTIDDTYNASNHGLIEMAYGGGSNNVVRFTATAAKMAALTPGTYSYDFAVQYGSASENFITTYTKGNFVINADI